MIKSNIFWQSYLSLEKEVIEVSKYIFFTDEVLTTVNGQCVSQPHNANLEAFSPHIADLLVSCCVQIEALSKELYFDNGGRKKRDDHRILFDYDCLKLIDKKWNTSKKTVLITAPFFNFTMPENQILTPLEKANQKEGCDWKQAYQALKHDRYTSLRQGNVKALLHALAALYMLNVYYRNDSWEVDWENGNNIDYSLGSSIFSVEAPHFNPSLWPVSAVKETTSPYVISYTEDFYKNCKSLELEAVQGVKDYIKGQLENQDKDFVQAFSNAIQDNDNSKAAFNIIGNLTKMQLEQQIPESLPFKKRKELLISSKEWNSEVHKLNKRVSEDELTADNIQQTIKHIAEYWGHEVCNNLFYEFNQYLVSNRKYKIHIPQGHQESCSESPNLSATTKTQS